MSKAVLITGATGKQGGAVVDALLAANTDYQILAVTRNVDSPSAKKLASRSSKIALVKGDLDNSAELFNNAKKVAKGPVWGVFSVQLAAGQGQTLESEVRQGTTLIDEALKHGVEFFVQTSVDRGGEAKSYDNPTAIPHFISKHRIEHHLVDKSKNTNMNWTILRPVAFFDNFAPGFLGKAFTAMWRVALKGKSFQLISSKDIGWFGAQALLDPATYKGRAISLAGDELTNDEFAKVYKDTIGETLPTTYGFVASIMLYLIKDLGIMFKWFHDEGYGANVEELRKIHPGLQDSKAWLLESSYAKKQQ